MFHRPNPPRGIRSLAFSGPLAKYTRDFSMLRVLFWHPRDKNPFSIGTQTAHSIFRSRTQIGDQLTIERYEPKKAPPEQTDTVLAGPPKPDDLTTLVSGGAVLPIAPQRADGERRRISVASKVN